MKDGPDIASLAALVGDPARANILAALMSGLALSAGELAREAGVGPPTATAHLAKMRDAGLLMVEIQGRHRYYRLAGPEVAAALEALMGLAARNGRLRTRPGPRDEALRRARVCYDHLAGELGVRLHDGLVERGLLAATRDGLGPTPQGRATFRAFGIDVEALEGKARPLCRTCFDWSERRHHLAGSLGAALLQTVLERGWATRDRASRAVVFSARGQAALDRLISGETISEVLANGNTST
jgi:DNA-binding transcriptional ArsR family regulator